MSLVPGGQNPITPQSYTNRQQPDPTLPTSLWLRQPQRSYQNKTETFSPLTLGAFPLTWRAWATLCVPTCPLPRKQRALPQDGAFLQGTGAINEFFAHPDLGNAWKYGFNGFNHLQGPGARADLWGDQKVERLHRGEQNILAARRYGQ